MNSMTSRDLDTHVPILGWLHIAGGAVMGLIGLFLLFLLLGIGAISADREAFGILAIVAIFVGGLMIVLALPGILAGWGLLRRTQWGRVLALVVGILNLLNFPIGTILGGYTIYVLLQEAAGPYFAERPTL